MLGKKRSIFEGSDSHGYGADGRVLSPKHLFENACQAIYDAVGSKSDVRTVQNAVNHAIEVYRANEGGVTGVKVDADLARAAIVAQLKGIVEAQPIKAEVKVLQLQDFMLKVFLNSGSYHPMVSCGASK
jgi:hypothetical protein